MAAIDPYPIQHYAHPSLWGTTSVVPLPSGAPALVGSPLLEIFLRLMAHSVYTVYLAALVVSLPSGAPSPCGLSSSGVFPARLTCIWVLLGGSRAFGQIRPSGAPTHAY